MKKRTKHIFLGSIMMTTSFVAVFASSMNFSNSNKINKNTSSTKDIYQAPNKKISESKSVSFTDDKRNLTDSSPYVGGTTIAPGLIRPFIVVKDIKNPSQQNASDGEISFTVTNYLPSKMTLSLAQHAKGTLGAFIPTPSKKFEGIIKVSGLSYSQSTQVQITLKPGEIWEQNTLHTLKVPGVLNSAAIDAQGGYFVVGDKGLLLHTDWKGDIIPGWTSKPLLGGNDITKIIPDNTDETKVTGFYVGGKGGKFSHINNNGIPTNGGAVLTLMNGQDIVDMQPISDGSILIGAGKDVIRYDKTGKELLSVQVPHEVKQISISEGENSWIAQKGGQISKINHMRTQPIQSMSVLGGSEITYIVKEFATGKGIWVAGDGGKVQRISETLTNVNSFHPGGPRTLVQGEDISAVVVDADTIVIITKNGVAQRWNYLKNRDTTTPSFKTFSDFNVRNKLRINHYIYNRTKNKILILAKGNKVVGFDPKFSDAHSVIYSKKQTLFYSSQNMTKTTFTHSIQKPTSKTAHNGVVTFTLKNFIPKEMDISLTPESNGTLGTYDPQAKTIKVTGLAFEEKAQIKVSFKEIKHSLNGFGVEDTTTTALNPRMTQTHKTETKTFTIVREALNVSTKFIVSDSKDTNGQKITNPTWAQAKASHSPLAIKTIDENIIYDRSLSRWTIDGSSIMGESNAWQTSLNGKNSQGETTTAEMKFWVESFDKTNRSITIKTKINLSAEGANGEDAAIVDDVLFQPFDSWNDGSNMPQKSELITVWVNPNGVSIPKLTHKIKQPTTTTSTDGEITYTLTNFDPNNFDIVLAPGAAGVIGEFDPKTKTIKITGLKVGENSQIHIVLKPNKKWKDGTIIPKKSYKFAPVQTYVGNNKITFSKKFKNPTEKNSKDGEVTYTITNFDPQKMHVSLSSNSSGTLGTYDPQTKTIKVTEVMHGERVQIVITLKNNEAWKDGTRIIQESPIWEPHYSPKTSTNLIISLLAMLISIIIVVIFYTKTNDGDGPISVKEY